MTPDMNRSPDITGPNVVALLQKAAHCHPDRAALIMEDKGKEKSISFAELWHEVACFAEAITQKGLRPGQRVIVMIPMSIDLYIVLLGIIKMGGVAVFVDPWIGTRQLAAFCTFAEPHGYIGIAKSHFLRLLDSKLLKIPLTISTGCTFLGLPARYTLNSMLKKALGTAGVYQNTANAPALITFTSGSSGLPKGANRTHGFLAAQHQALKHEFPYDDNAIDMPMFPVFALNNLAGQRTSIIPSMDFRKVAEVDGRLICRQLQRHGVTTCTASPPFFDRLASYLEENPDHHLNLQRILTGGAVVTDNQLRRWRQTFPATRIDIVYGSTEAEPVAHITLEERLATAEKPKARGTCAGRPSSLVELKIIKISKEPVSFQGWQGLEITPGQAGEIIVSGKHVCRDYFNNLEAGRENKIIDNQGIVWHRMGDTGYLDKDGLLWLVGRLHSTIIRAGVIIHAQLIEQQLTALFPESGKIAVLGMADSVLGEHVALVFERTAALPAQQEMPLHLQGQNITFDALYVTPAALPLDPRHNTKIDYQLLRRQIASKELEKYGR